MGGRGAHSASSQTNELSSHNAALKDFLDQGAAEYAKGRNAASKELSAEASAMSAMIGSDRLNTLLDSGAFSRIKSIMKFNGLASGKINDMLAGHNKPLGMNAENFSNLQESLKNLKSMGFSNEEIAGAARWGRQVER